MNDQDKKTLVDLRQTLRQGVSAIHDEKRQFEQDRDTLAALAADVDDRTQRIRPDSEEAAALEKDRLKVQSWALWLGQRHNRWAVVGEKLVSVVRCAVGTLRDIEGSVSNYCDWNKACPQDATHYAGIAMSRIEALLNPPPAPPPQPVEEERFYTGSPPVSR